MTLLSKVAFAQGFYKEIMEFDTITYPHERDHSHELTVFFRENDFTEDFLKGNCWDIPGDINKPRYYLEY